MNLAILAFLWPRNMTTDKTKERNTHEPLMIYSWTTHKRGPLDTDSFIHSYIHSLWIKHSVGFLGFLRIPLDPLGFPDEHREGFFFILGIPKGSFGPLRIYRWISWGIPDPCLSWMICLSITDLRGLFKDVHQSKFFVAPTHEKLMTHSWTTHEWAELLNTHRQIKMMTPTAR